MIIRNLFRLDPVELGKLRYDIRVCQMGVRCEHFRGLVTPPDLPDTVFPDLLTHQLTDSGMPENVRRHFFSDTGALCDNPDPFE